MNDAMDGIARLEEVERLSGMSRSSIYRLESRGQFPSRVKLGERAVGWSRESVRAWCQSRPSARSERAA